MEEHEIDGEVFVADLDWVLRANETEVAPELGNESPQIVEKRGVKVGFGVTVL